MDKNYWNEYYTKHDKPFPPSQFAEWVVLKGHTALELGCGNGRDITYLHKKYEDITFTGIDQCESEIQLLNTLYSDNKLKFVSDDFTNLKLKEQYDNIYSRFTLHSITEKEEIKVLNWVHEHLTAQGQFLIEVRSIKDELCGVGKQVNDNSFITDHYRRFVSLIDFEHRLEQIGFYIYYIRESQGFAPHNNEDPFCIRVIARKFK